MRESPYVFVNEVTGETHGMLTGFHVSCLAQGGLNVPLYKNAYALSCFFRQEDLGLKNLDKVKLVG